MPFLSDCFLGGLSNIMHIGGCGHLCNRTHAILAPYGTVLFQNYDYLHCIFL